MPGEESPTCFACQAPPTLPARPGRFSRLREHPRFPKSHYHLLLTLPQTPVHCSRCSLGQVDQCGALMNIHKCHLLHEAYTIPSPVPRRPPSPGSFTVDTAPMSLPSCAARVKTLTLQRLEPHRLAASLYLVSLHAGRVAHSRLSEDAWHENKTIHILLNARPPGKSP